MYSAVINETQKPTFINYLIQSHKSNLTMNKTEKLSVLAFIYHAHRYAKVFKPCFKSTRR